MKKRKIILAILIIIIIIIIISSIILILNKKEVKKYELNKNSLLAIMVYDDETEDYVKQDTIPTGNYILNLANSYCLYGSSLEYNSSTGVVTTSMEYGDECYLYFDIKPTGARKIISLANDDESDVVNSYGYRYIGKNPNNFVMFNGELWRIIGVFEEQYDSTGNNAPDKNEYLVKIIRNNGFSAPWDYKTASVGFFYIAIWKQ